VIQIVELAALKAPDDAVAATVIVTVSLAVALNSPEPAAVSR